MLTQIIAPRAGQVQLDTVESQTLKKGHVLLRSRYTALSPGTELAWINHAANTPGVFPFRPGYSGCGEVIAVADDVTNMPIGCLVAGCFKHAAEQQLPAADLVPLPDEASLEQVQLREISAFHLATIAMHGARRAAINLESRVLIFGLGPIGLLAAQWALASGAREVLGVDLLRTRRDCARDCGIDACSPDEIPHQEFTSVIEVSGVPQVIPQALQYTSTGGRLCLLGSTRGLVEHLDAYALIHKKQIDVCGAHLWGREQATEAIRKDNQLCLDFMLQQRIHLAPLTTAVFAPSDCAMVYAQLGEHPEQSMIPIFDWSL